MTTLHQRIDGSYHQHTGTGIQQRGIVADAQRHIGPRLQIAGEPGNDAKLAEIIQTHGQNPLPQPERGTLQPPPPLRRPSASAPRIAPRAIPDDVMAPFRGNRDTEEYNSVCRACCSRPSWRYCTIQQIWAVYHLFGRKEVWKS